MKKFITTLVFTIFLLSNLSAQKMKWHSFEEAVELNKTEPKKFLLSVYTNWCGYCKKMDKKTFQNNIITDYINKYYYPVKLNAEQRDSIEYAGKKFGLINYQNRRYNEFAVSILDGRMAFPSTLILDEKHAIIETIPGYLEPSIMEKILVYYGEEKFLTGNVEEFEKNFKSKL